jgi:hypothetical protein
MSSPLVSGARTEDALEDAHEDLFGLDKGVTDSAGVPWLPALLTILTGAQAHATSSADALVLAPAPRSTDTVCDVDSKVKDMLQVATDLARFQEMCLKELTVGVEAAKAAAKKTATAVLPVTQLH